MSTVKGMLRQIEAESTEATGYEVFENWRKMEGAVGQAEELRFVLESEEISEATKRKLIDMTLEEMKRVSGKMRMLAPFACEREVHNASVSSRIREKQRVPGRFPEMSAPALVVGFAIGALIALLAHEDVFSGRIASFLFGVTGETICVLSVVLAVDEWLEAKRATPYKLWEAAEAEQFSEYGERVYYKLLSVRGEAENLAELAEVLKRQGRGVEVPDEILAALGVGVLDGETCDDAAVQGDDSVTQGDAPAAQDAEASD